MRCPVYRNLDQPFHVLGFRPPEIILIAVVFVLGGELGDLLSIHRGWAFGFSCLAALLLFLFRRSFGELYGRRLLRFISLPSFLFSRLFFSSESQP